MSLELTDPDDSLFIPSSEEFSNENGPTSKVRNVLKLPLHSYIQSAVELALRSILISSLLLRARSDLAGRGTFFFSRARILSISGAFVHFVRLAGVFSLSSSGIIQVQIQRGSLLFMRATKVRVSFSRPGFPQVHIRSESSP